jgi:hypothetical protein
MIRFISKGGLGSHTQLVDAESGADLSKVLAVEYGATIELGNIVKATCRIAVCEVDLLAGKTEFLTKHPVSGEYLAVAAIEFRDGTRVEMAEDGTPSVKVPSA